MYKLYIYCSSVSVPVIQYTYSTVYIYTGIYIAVMFQCQLYIQYICIYIVVLFQCRCCACLSPMWARWARKGARWRLTRPSGRTTVPSVATGSAPPAHPTFPSRWYIYSFTFILVNPIIIVMFLFIFNCFGANPPPLFDVTESEKINNLFS